MSVPKLRFKREDGSNYPDWTPAAMGNYYTERREAGNDKLPVLSVSIHSGVSNNELDEAELGKRVKRIEDKSAYRVAHKGDLVFNMMRAWQGAVGSSPTKGMVSPAYIVAIPDERLDPDFMNYYVQTRSVIDEFNMLSYGVTDFRKRLYWDSFSIAKFHVPSIEEQKRIADCLSGIDKMLQICHEELEKTKQFKKAYLQKMFPQKGRTLPEVRFPGFTDEWEQRKLGDVCQITMGQSPDGSTYSDTESDYILVQGNADLKDGWVFPRIWTTQKTKTADAGDLIMSVRAPAGAMGKTAYDVVLGRGVAGIKGNEFIFQTLVKMDSDGYWKKLAAGSTFESINSDAVKNAEILTPTREEQEKIGEYFSNLDTLIALHQRECEKWQELKKGLLQQLFI